MTAFVAVCATLASTCALAYLAASDPKRRRVFGLAPWEGQRRTWAALAVVFLPGLLLLAFGNGSGFVIWLGAITITGWGVAAMTPAQGGRVVGWLGAAAMRMRDGAVGIGAGTQAAGRALAAAVDTLRHAPARIAALEDRVAALEAELARIRELGPRSTGMREEETPVRPRGARRQAGAMEAHAS